LQKKIITNKGCNS